MTTSEILAEADRRLAVAECARLIRRDILESDFLAACLIKYGDHYITARAHEACAEIYGGRDNEHD